jgi:hypothetical protein
MHDRVRPCAAYGLEDGRVTPGWLDPPARFRGVARVSEAGANRKKNHRRGGGVVRLGEAVPEPELLHPGRPLRLAEASCGTPARSRSRSVLWVPMQVLLSWCRMMYTEKVLAVGGIST